MRTIRKSVMLAALMAAVTFTSCSNDDEVTDNNQPVRFTAGIGEVATLQTTPGTRASEITWDGGDAIGIFMVDHTYNNTIAENAVNKQYTTTGDGAFTAVSGNEIYYPMDNNSLVDFIAYYPWENNATLTSSIDVTIGDQTDQPEFDLLWAKATNGGGGYNKKFNNDVALVFEHKLAKIVMNTSAGEGVSSEDLAGMEVTIKGMKTTGTFSLSAGTLGDPEISDEIIPRTVGNDGDIYEYDAIIMPASYTAGVVTVDFTLQGSGEIFTWNVGEVLFDGGNEYIYDVKLTRTGVQVTGTIIKSWTTNTHNPVTAE